MIAAGDDQLSLGETLRDEGMARALAHADPVFVMRVDAVILDFARNAYPFIADDVHLRVGEPPAGTSPNVVGQRFRHAAQNGWIRKTGVYVPSQRPSLRHHPLPEWVGTEKAGRE